MGLIALTISAKSIRHVPLPHPRHGSGSDVLGARASCPQRAEGPQSADRSDTPEPATPPPEAHNAVEAGLGCTAEGWRWSSPRAWRRPLAHVAGLRPACGRDARAPRDGARASLADSVTRRLCAAGPFQTLGEEVDGSVSGTGSWTSAGHVLVARHPLLPRRARIRWRFEHPRQSDESWCPNPRVTSRWIGDRLFERSRPIGRHGSGSDVLGARASCPQRAEGPQSADRSDTPEPATPPPEAHNAVEAGLGCTAEGWRWSSPRAWRRPLAHVAGLRPACGRDARAPRDGARASLADSAPQGHSKLSARRLMAPCREQVHGLRQGTSLWPVTRFSPGERESDGASSIRGNPMNLGAPTPA